MLPTGKVIGPYSTEAVLKLIQESAINEECRIKRMGSGTWSPLAKETLFFDALLEATQNPKKQDTAASQENFFSETVIVRAPASAEPTDFGHTRFANQNEEMTVPGVPEVIEAPQTKALTTSKAKAKSGGDVLDLDNITKVARAEGWKTSKGPFALIAGALVLGVAAFFMDRAPSADDLRLILPKLDLPPATNFDARAAQNQLLQARNAFWTDTVEGYLQAQNQLVPLIEAAPQYMPARGLLCLVYRELWPYVEQSKSDTDAVARLSKSTKSLDPVGPAGAHCEIARLLTQGKMTEARGMVDYYLESADLDRREHLRLLESQGKEAHRFSSDPVMMSFRAELLASLKDEQLSRSDPAQAASYVQNIQQYTPRWVKMYYMQARFLLQAGRPQEAAQAFERTLKVNSAHKPALIEFGIMNYTQFRQADKALNYISGALKSRGIITRSLEGRAHYTLARIFAEKNELSEALGHAEKAYELNPSDNLAKNLVVELGGSIQLGANTGRNNTLVFEGDQHAREGDCLMAQALYKSAFEADPKNALAAMKAAKCLKTLNRPREAISWLQKTIKVDPKLATAYLLLADYYSEAYDFRRAESILNQASAKFPNQYEILRGYGLVAYRQNRLKEALAYLNRALRGYEGDIETMILLAKTHFEAKDYQNALSFAARALELDRANVEAHIVYGRTLAPFKGLDAAINYLREQRAQFSKNVEYPLAIAELYRDTGRCSMAENEFKAVIEWRPDTKAAYIGLGECYFMAGDVIGALKSFFDAAYYDTSDADPFVRIGMIYISANRFAEAIPQLKRALEVNELKPMARYYLGKAYFGLGDFKAALEWAQQESKYNPGLADAYVLAADIYAKTDNYKACTDQYQKAVGLRRNNRAELYVNMARCQRQAQNLDGAQGSLDIAITLESGRAEIYREQGALFELRGDIRAAAAAYNKYLTLSPNAPDRQDVESQLSRMGGRIAD